MRLFKPDTAKLLARRDVAGLAKALRDPDESLRARAARALGTLGSPEAVEPLIAALREDAYGPVREAAATALGQIRDPTAVQPLLAACHETSRSISGAAGEALGRLGPAAVEPLIAALQDRDTRVGCLAAKALGQIGDVRAIEPLLQALGAGGLRAEAAAAIERIGIPQDRALRARYAVGKHDWDLAVSLGNAVDPLLVLLQQERDGVIRHAAARTLGRIGDARAVGPLCTGLRDEEVRWGASEALRAIGAPAVDALVEMLHDPSPYVREAVVDTLGPIGDPRATGPLIQMLQDSSFEVRRAAAQQLGLIADARAVEPLIALLHDQWPVVRETAAHVLARIGGERALDALIRALDDEEQSGEVGKAMERMGTGAVEPLIGVLAGGSVCAVESAARTLGALGDCRAVGPLCSVLRHASPRPRAAAANALRALGSTAAVPALVCALRQDDNSWAGRDIASALSGITGQSFGEDAARWERWMAEPPHMEA